jgi:hypothetical protein
MEVVVGTLLNAADDEVFSDACVALYAYPESVNNSFGPPILYSGVTYIIKEYKDAHQGQKERPWLYAPGYPMVDFFVRRCDMAAGDFGPRTCFSHCSYYI